MWVEDLYPVFRIVSYMILGMTIGILEVQSHYAFKSQFCREHPHLHVLSNTLAWPLIYIAINRVDVLPKIIKAVIACYAFFYIQGFAYKFIVDYMGTWAMAPAILLAIALAPLVVGLLRMPGIGNQNT